MTYRRRARPGFRCSVLLAATTLLGCTELDPDDAPPQDGNLTGGNVGTTTSGTTNGVATTTSGVATTTNGVGTTANGVGTTTSGEATTTTGAATTTTGVGVDATGVGTSTGGADAGMTGGADSGATGATTGDGVQTLPPTDDYSAPGQFGSTEEPNVGPDGNYTIFRPDPLSTDGFLHSPIILGPGILTGPGTYADLLHHLASHGFVTIMVNSLLGGPGDEAHVEAMREGLDWLIAQNDEPGLYQGKLAVDRAAATGYSLGATASVKLASHEAILTAVAIHGHQQMVPAEPHGPVLLLTGTDDVIDGNRTALSQLEAPTMMTALPIGHLDVFFSELSTSGRYIEPITAWLRYWINGDENAKRYFWGDGCVMCSSPWEVTETNAAWDAQTL